MKYGKHLTAPFMGCAAIALLTATPAHAVGVTAGTLIDNTATATYSTGETTTTLDSNTVTIKVDEILDVAVGSQDGGDVPLSSSAVLKFSVTNTGNGPEAFVLTADPEVADNDFEVTIDGLAIDTDGNGIYEPGADTPLANGGLSDVLGPDSTITVFVLVTAPDDIGDGATSRVSLSADAVTGTGEPGTVFAGAGEDGSDAVVGSSSAAAEDPGSLIASLATLSLTKSAAVADPFGGTQAVPGAIITYSIVASVAGQGSLSDLSISDAIPQFTTYAAGTLTLDDSALTDAADGDAGEASSSGVAVNLGTVTAGTSHTITFDVQINED